MQVYLSLILCCILGFHGLKKKSLSVDGAISAFILGFIIFTHADLLWSVVLLAFYLSGSKVTKVGSDRKKGYEEGYLDCGQRASIQVWANGLTGAILSIIDRTLLGTYYDQCYQDSSITHWILFTGYLAHFACW